MGSYSGQRDHGSHEFTSRTPHFFKVLLRDAIEHGKLKVPAQFAKKYGSGISSPIFLKVPSGAVWRLELAKSNAEIWFQRGWREFVEHYSLQLHDFVVFRYEGNSLFNVIIFDKSASEIEYPINSSQAGNLNSNGETQGPTTEEDDDTSVEILDDMPPGRKRREKSPLPCPRPSRKMRIHSNTNRTKSNAHLQTSASKFISKATEVSDIRFEDPNGNGSSSTSVEILDDIPPARKIREKSPLPCPQLSRKMRIHSDTNRTETNAQLPTLASKFISKGTKVSDIKVEVPSVNGSSPRHSQGFSGNDRGSNAAKVSNGGMNASQKLGHTDVHRRMQKTMRGQEKVRALERASSFKSQNPFFVVVMQPSFVTGRYRLVMPRKFSRKYLISKHRKVLCVIDGRSWSMEFMHNKANKQRPNPRLGNGWKEFSQDNNLDIGDVCVFELVKSTKMTFNVLIFRGEVADPCQSAGNFNQMLPPQTAGAQDIQGASTPGVFEASSNFAPKNPNFKVVVRSARNSLYLPKGFAERYFMPETRMAILQVAERSWPMKLICTSNSRFVLSSGWKVFAKENSLQANDVCVFEPVNRSDAVVRVHISRCAG